MTTFQNSFGVLILLQKWEDKKEDWADVSKVSSSYIGKCLCVCRNGMTRRRHVKLLFGIQISPLTKFRRLQKWEDKVCASVSPRSMS